MRCKTFAVICIFSCVALFFKTEGQEVPHFIEQLTTTEGLSGNKINDLLQDDIGFLWVATSNGLNRYDGTEVLQYFHKPGQNSLPHNYIYCIKKLPGNFLAIGTQNGLSFLNVNTGRFQHFYYRQNNRLDEYNNTILALETDKQGNLWVASKNCIFIFNTERQIKKTIPSPFTEADTYHERLKFVLNVFPLTDGNVLLNLFDGWHICDAKTFSVTPIGKTSLSKQPAFLRILVDTAYTKKKEIIFTGANIFRVYENYFLCLKSGSDSILLFDTEGRQLSSCSFPFNQYPYVSWSQQVSLIDSSKLLFIFHNYGFAIVNIKWIDGKPLLRDASSLLFDNREYVKAIADKQGNWWLATGEEGLQKINPAKQSFTGLPLLNASGKEIKYATEYIYRQGNRIWVATYGEGFFEVDLLTKKYQQHLLQNTNNDLWANFCWNIRQVNEDTLWVGTQAGLFWYCISKKHNGRITGYKDKPPALDTVATTTQFVDSRGLVWMGMGRGKGVCYVDNLKKQFNYFPSKSLQGYPLRYPLRIGEDKSGNLWFTSDAGTALVKWNRNTTSFETIELPLADKQDAGAFYGLYCEGDSVIWLGGLTSGLIKFNRINNKIIIYGHEKGLLNSHITSIFQDTEKRIWLVTEGGLSCFDQRSERFTNYTSKEGLPVKYPTADFYYDKTDKRLYNGGYGGIFYFNPGTLANRPAPKKTIITAIHVNGNPIMLDDQPLRFSSKQNDIAITYAAIDLADGPVTRYEYKLMGNDTAWVMAGNQRQINFSRLAPGDYTFVVRSSNSNGVWSNDMASIQFFIRPPFTQTIWFYMLIFMLIAMLFYGLYRFRLRQVMRTQEIRSEISRDLHDEVGSALTNISLETMLAQKHLHNEAVLKNILERIQQDSRKVSETIREIVWSINPEIDTAGEAFPRMLRYAADLLEAKDIVVEADINPGIDKLVLAMQQRRDIYLIFKEAINNLAKHADCTKVKISISLHGSTLVMKISDNGIGFNINNSFLSSGLKNMQARAVAHNWKLQIESALNAGTTIILNARIA